MSEYMIVNGELCHHGVKGQKWGVRRYQNPDGTLTPAGKKRAARAEFRRDKMTLHKALFKKGRYVETIDPISKQKYYVHIRKQQDVIDDMIAKKGEEYTDKVIRRAGLEMAIGPWLALYGAAFAAAGAVYVADKFGK